MTCPSVDHCACPPEACGALHRCARPANNPQHHCIRPAGHFPATPHGDYSAFEWTAPEPHHQVVPS